MLNWAKNISYRSREIATPESEQELRSLIARSDRLKVLGSRHSFNRIADTDGLHLSLERLPRRVEIDRSRSQATVSADLPYGSFCEFLHQNGFALHNLASLPHISVAGACATATHGSGVRHRNLASAVAALRMISSDGSPLRLTRADEDFGYVVAGLGALGVIVEMTLDLQPSFAVRQWGYEGLSMEGLDDYFEQVMSCAYSVSFFTDWRAETFTQVWIKEMVDDPELDPSVLPAARKVMEAHGARPAEFGLHPVDGDPACCTQQLGEPGPWHDRLPHFRMSFTPSDGVELQAEYFVARQDAPAVLRELATIRSEIAPLLLITEVRTIAADDLPMSSCYQRDSVAIHFTLRQHLGSHEEILPSGLTPETERSLGLIEGTLAPFHTRPHLGKLFTLSSGELSQVYPNLSSFRSVAKRYDPTSKFSNEFLRSKILGDEKL